MSCTHSRQVIVSRHPVRTTGASSHKLRQSCLLDSRPITNQPPGSGAGATSSERTTDGHPSPSLAMAPRRARTADCLRLDGGGLMVHRCGPRAAESRRSHHIVAESSRNRRTRKDDRVAENAMDPSFSNVLSAGRAQAALGLNMDAARQPASVVWVCTRRVERPLRRVGQRGQGHTGVRPCCHRNGSGRQ